MLELNLQDGAAAEAAIEQLWLKLHHIARLREISTDSRFRTPTSLTSYMMVVAERGEVQFTIDDRLLLLRQGAVFLGVPGQRVAYMGSALNGTEEGYVLLFEVQGDPNAQAALVRRNGKDRDGGVIPEAASAILPELCEQACLCWQHPSGREKLRGQAVFHEIVYHALAPAEEAGQPDRETTMEQMKLYLDLHYHESLSIEQLAQRAGISSRHFRRAFRSRYGISATDYLTDLRISQAKRLMTATKHSIAEIARQVGYQDESHFRRTFKNQMGISPALYVRSRQLRVAACSFPNIGQLLPLNVIPFAAPIDHEWTDHYRRKFRTEVQYPLHHHNEINRKTLIAARPDCILAIDRFGSTDFQQQLHEIAPVLVIPWHSGSWREHLMLTASFLSRTRQAEDWLSDYDEKMDRICERWNRAAAAEKLLIYMIDRQHCFQWINNGGGRMDRDCFPFAPARHNKTVTDPSFTWITVEELAACEDAEADADGIVLLLSDDPHAQLTWQEVQQSEQWRSRKAVRRGRVTTIKLGPWFEYTAYNHGAIADQVIKWLP